MPLARQNNKQTEKNQDISGKEAKIVVHSYKQLLLKDKNEPYKRIYVTADAGMGKTSFAKHLAMTWCEAHSPSRNTLNTSEECLVGKRLEGSDNQDADTGDMSDHETCPSSVSTTLSGSENTYTDLSYDTDYVTSVTNSSNSSYDTACNTDDVETLGAFDFFFLIKLREYLCSNICSIDDMILSMITTKLKSKSHYSAKFIEKLLGTRRCLILVDGLDEWIHPKECPTRVEIPHWKPWPYCSILTTTRKWKLCTAQLSVNDIDRHVEICQLDKASSAKLVNLAFQCLEENQLQHEQLAESPPTERRCTGSERPLLAKSSPETFLTDNSPHQQTTKGKERCKKFKRTISKLKLQYIWHIPYILLQMLCLWFEGSKIGKSLCEVYTNIIELTLTRWLIKTDPRHKSHNCDCKPLDLEFKCMQNKIHCCKQLCFLESIGKLAFYTLFNTKQEITLVFDKKTILDLNHIEEADMEKCFAIGLLSQVKDTNSLSKVHLKLCFPHKTIQEYFCGLFLATNWDKDTATTLLKKCDSVSDMLEMSKVFLFICGMKSEVYSMINKKLSFVVERDQTVINYRTLQLKINKYVGPNVSNVLFSYQNAQLECMLESETAQQGQCKLVLDDIFISGSLDNREAIALCKLIQNNAKTMKSLFISAHDVLIHGNFHLQTELWRTLDACAPFLCLETLYVQLEKQHLARILIASAYSLKYLYMSDIILTEEHINAIVTLKSLHCLYFETVSTPDESRRFSKWISNCKSLRKIYISGTSITIDEWLPFKRQVQSLHLTRLSVSQLQYLRLKRISVSILDICSETLTTCSLHDCSLPHEALASFFVALQTKTMLNKLKLEITCEDHGYGCPGFTLNLSQNSKLEKLIINKQQTLYDEERNVHLKELHISNNHLQNIEINMHLFSAEAISSFLTEIHGAPVLKSLVIWSIRYPPDRMDIVLPQLTTFQLECHINCDNNFILDLSHLGKLQDIRPFSNVRELHINTENLRTAEINMKHFSADAISSLLREIQGAPMLETLNLQRIRHPTDRMDIVLPQLTTFELQCTCDCDNIFILDLSQLGKLEHIFLDTKLRELHINTENLITAGINMRDISSDALSSFLREIHGAQMLKILELNRIILPSISKDTEFTQIEKYQLQSDRDCKNTLDLSKLGKLQDISLNIKFSQIHIISENLRTATINMAHLSADTISSFLKEIQGAPVLKTLTLQNIRHPPDRMDIALPQLTTFELQCDCDCDNIFSLDLSKLGNLQYIRTLKNVRELHIHTKNLMTALINMAHFSADTISSLLREIQGAPMLKTLSLQSIRHPPDRMNIALPQLTIFDLQCDCDNIFILDLSQVGMLQDIRPFKNVKELHINTENLRTAEINMEHFSADTINSFLREIQGAPVLKTLKLLSIRHPPDRMNIALPQLTTFDLQCDCGCDNIFILDLSRLGKLQDIRPYKNVRELHINTENLRTANINMEHFSTDAISSFLRKIQGASMLKTLNLQGIKHPPDRMDIALPQLTTFELQCNCDKIFIWGFTQRSKLQEIRPFKNVKELHMNTKNLMTAKINMEHFSTDAISSFLREIQGASMLKTLNVQGIRHPPDRMDIALPQLTSFQLQCHSNCDNIFILDLSQLGMLEDIRPFKNVRELHINTDNLRAAVIDMEYFSAETISSFMRDIQEALLLSELSLMYIRHPPDRMEIPALPLLEQLEMWNCNLGDSILTFSSEIIRLETIRLVNLTITKPSLRHLILSIGKLPQHLTTYYEVVKDNLLDITGKLQLVIGVTSTGQLSSAEEREDLIYV